MTQPHSQASSSWEFKRFSDEDFKEQPEVPPLASLCNACSSLLASDLEVNILSREIVRAHRYDFPLRISDIFDNATKETCAFCFMVWQCLRSKTHGEFNGREVPQDAALKLRVWSRTDKSILGVDFTFDHPSWPKTHRSNGTVLLHPLPQSKDLLYGPWQREGSNDSHTSVNLARAWSRNCRERHAKCKLPSSSSGFKPTRLVYLGDSESLIASRLVLSGTVPGQVEYATLSHCWGSSKFMRLEKHSLEAMLQSIPESGLSKTFKHAMIIARRLGFHFLWIDSLCIIQDNDDDWRAEARAMADVYENSQLNTAATKSSSGEGGCFSSRSPRDVIPVVIKLGLSLVLSNPDLWDEKTTFSPLCARGWVVQETILARLVLHFAEGQMFWECKDLRASETFPGRVYRDRRAYPGKRSLDPDCVSFTNQLPGDTVARRKYMLWNEIVGEYTKTSITYPEKDKIIAISGIARKLGLDDELVAGLWRERLPYQLLWAKSPDRADHAERSTGGYQAPMNGHVNADMSENNMRRLASRSHAKNTGNTESIREKIYVTVKHAKISHLDDDPRAQLIDGVLTLQGPMFPLSPILKRPGGNTTGNRFPLGTQSSTHREIHVEIYVDFGVCGRKGQVKNNDIVHCMIILLQEYEDNFDAYGLILVAEDKKGEYKRVGLLEVVGSAFEGNKIENLENWLRAGVLVKDDEFELVSRDHTDGIPRYLITIK